MKKSFFIMAIILPVVVAGGGGAESRRGESKASVSFSAVDLWIDAGKKSLAAYQLEVRYHRTDVKIVGIEGGETKAFNKPPFYDRKGMKGGRIIIAAFNTRDDIAPKGKTRVARLHLFSEGGSPPALRIKLVTAARPGGKRFNPAVQITKAVAIQ